MDPGDQDRCEAANARRREKHRREKREAALRRRVSLARLASATPTNAPGDSDAAVAAAGPLRAPAPAAGEGPGETMAGGVDAPPPRARALVAHEQPAVLPPAREPAPSAGGQGGGAAGGEAAEEAADDVDMADPAAEAEQLGGWACAEAEEVSGAEVTEACAPAAGERPSTLAVGEGPSAPRAATSAAHEPPAVPRLAAGGCQRGGEAGGAAEGAAAAINVLAADATDAERRGGDADPAAAEEGDAEGAAEERLAPAAGAGPSAARAAGADAPAPGAVAPAQLRQGLRARLPPAWYVPPDSAPPAAAAPRAPRQAAHYQPVAMTRAQAASALPLDDLGRLFSEPAEWCVEVLRRPGHPLLLGARAFVCDACGGAVCTACAVALTLGTPGRRGERHCGACAEDWQRRCDEPVTTAALPPPPFQGITLVEVCGGLLTVYTQLLALGLRGCAVPVRCVYASEGCERVIRMWDAMHADGGAQGWRLPDMHVRDEIAAWRERVRSGRVRAWRMGDAIRWIVCCDPCVADSSLAREPELIADPQVGLHILAFLSHAREGCVIFLENVPARFSREEWLAAVIELEADHWVVLTGEVRAEDRQHGGADLVDSLRDLGSMQHRVRCIFLAVRRPLLPDPRWHARTARAQFRPHVLAAAEALLAERATVATAVIETQRYVRSGALTQHAADLLVRPLGALPAALVAGAREHRAFDASARTIVDISRSSLYVGCQGMTEHIGTLTTSPAFYDLTAGRRLCPHDYVTAQACSPLVARAFARVLGRQAEGSEGELGDGAGADGEAPRAPAQPFSARDALRAVGNAVEGRTAFSRIAALVRFMPRTFQQYRGR